MTFYCFHRYTVKFHVWTNQNSKFYVIMLPPLLKNRQIGITLHVSGFWLIAWLCSICGLIKCEMTIIITVVK